MKICLEIPDFGKYIFPALLENGEKMVSYRFEGYWKDVGTVQSLWEANMELIDTPPKFDIYDSWSIYSRNTALAPQYVGENAKIIESSVAQGSSVLGKINHSVVFSGVHIGEDTEISDSVIMPDVKIGNNVKITKAVIGQGAVIEDGAIIGETTDENSPYISSMCTDGLVLIEGGATVSENADIPKGSMVEAN